MPFLHGFRRIVYEYQPLVDALSLCVIYYTHARYTSVDCTNHVSSVDENVCKSLMELLEKESQSLVFTEGISYSLFKVAELGRVSPAKVLLRYGADVNFEDPVSYYTPLHIAVLRNKPHMVQMLVGHGAKIDKRDRVHESSPLDLASEEADRLSCLCMLLDLGADVNAKDKNGADVHATTHDGENPLSSLIFLVKEALDSSVEDATVVGHFCIRVANLLLDHGADPSCCLNTNDGEEWEPSLTYTSLEHFDLLFPLAVVLLQRGSSFFCSCHSMSCWTGYNLIFTRLKEALHESLNAVNVADLLAKAEVLIEIAQLCSPHFPPFPTHSVLSMQEKESIPEPLLELQKRLGEQEARPLPLRSLCRVHIRHCLQPWPLDKKIKALPLPDRLKDYLMPDHSLTCRPGSVEIE
uniref:SOCS box domain-containing protein n=1 Tax=Electrophorus electricus TaxID=8005 RepID=A0A4W4FHX7_ELEEL